MGWEAAIFGMDGVVGTAPIHNVAWKHMAAALGRSLSLDRGQARVLPRLSESQRNPDLSLDARVGRFDVGDVDEEQLKETCERHA